MKDYKLIEPCAELEKEFMNMVNDYRINGVNDYPRYYNGKFTQFLHTIRELRKGVDLPQEVPTTYTYWLINLNNQILGTIRYREYLNEYTIIDGGHIGYDISPSNRKLGYCSIMLDLLLDKLKERTIEKVLLTVEENNLASIKVIENNGGVLDNIVESESSNELMRRYWIHL